ncbi:MAG TPA: hypothetical protein VI547_03670 [Anaerolineales bacterium]|nr:hypothetical protein [Anaerolineales bacterium]
MKIINSRGDSFALQVVGYQYPQHKEKNKYDPNWLLIQIHATLNGESWTATDPCLLTWEVEYLIKWLARIDKGEPTRRLRCSFIEPYLVLEQRETEAGKALRVYLERQLRPKSAYNHFAGQEDFWIEFPYSEIQFASVVESLQAQLGRFPKRVMDLITRRDLLEP